MLSVVDTASLVLLFVAHDARLVATAIIATVKLRIKTKIVVLIAAAHTVIAAFLCYMTMCA